MAHWAHYSKESARKSALQRCTPHQIAQGFSSVWHISIGFLFIF